MKKILLYEINSKLGSLEKEVFQLVNKENKPKDIVEMLKIQNKKYAYTTIMTVMDRLWKKGYLKRVKKEKTYYYSKIYPDHVVINNTSLYLTKKLIFLFSPLKILKNLFYLIIFFPLVNFINQPYLNGFVVAGLFLLIIFTVLNSVLTLYFNGFFEYLSLLIKEPSLIFNYWLINFHYFQEIFLSLGFLILAFALLFLIKKILNFKNFKDSYQFKNI
ncbi:MAG: hypothetical protein KatS3mg092_0272 [Patescibacteria group bacterium]|nr:MAG: hypothetical protein KatS3mg092_0272 [Patescibacteria group bacterium]